MKLIKDKTFYSTLASVGVPIALQNMIGFGVNMTDTIMLGKLGETQLSAASVASQPFFIFSVFTFGLASGASVLISQYWGKKNMDAIRHVVAIVLRIAIAVSLLVGAVVFFFPMQVLSIFSDEQAVLQEGVKYLKAVALTYVLYGITNTYFMVLRSIEIVRFPLFVNIFSCVLDIFLNYALIFGHFGAPAMGIEGAAVSTVFSRGLELVILLVYNKHFEKKLRFSFIRHLFARDAALFNDYIRYSIPVVLNELLWSVGTTIQTFVFGHIGSETVAANSVTSVITQFASVFLFGIGNAAAVMIGKTVGGGKKEEAMDMAFTFQVINAFAGAFACLIILLTKNPFIQFYHISENTKRIAADMINVAALIVFFQSFSITNVVGILRGGGDTRFALVMDILFLWIFSAPLGILSGLVLHWPIGIVFFLLKADEVIKVFFSVTRIISGKWIRNVTRE